MIENWHVREALRSRLGSALVDEPGIPDRAAELLRSYAPYKDTFAGLGPSMTVRMDDGSTRRVRTAELKDAADDVMGVLFDQLKVYSVSYDSLHSYCMETGSFSAMRTLCTRFGEFLPASERKIMARIIRDTRPPKDWESWLPPEESAN